MIPTIIGIAILLLIVIVLVMSYNSFVRLLMTVEEAFSNMDIELKKRFDLIPNLVETVKGYMGHEQETLTRLVNLRSVDYTKMTDQEKIENSSEIARVIPKIMAVAENYPDLKASTNFLKLSDQLTQIEEDIANARKYYNGAVKQYNIKIRTVPSNLVAVLFRFEKKPLYELEDDNERQNVKVEF